MAKRTDIDLEKVRQQAAELSHVITEQAHSLGDKAAFLAHEATDWAAPRVDSAKHTVDTAKHWVEPKLHEAAEWAEPRLGAAKDTAAEKLDKAWRESVKVAAPKVEEVAGRAKPVVENAYEKVIEDYLPRIQKAMQDAAAAASADGTLAERASGAGAAVEKALTAQPKSHRGTKTLGWVLVGSVAAGAGYLLWRRTQPVEDPWAEEYWQDVEGGKPATAATFADKASEAAHKASGAAKEAAEKASGVAKEAAEKASGAAKEAAEKVKHVVEDASHKIEEVAHKKEGAAAGGASELAEAAAEATTEAEESEVVTASAEETAGLEEQAPEDQAEEFQARSE